MSSEDFGCTFDTVVFDLWNTLLIRPFPNNLHQQFAALVGRPLDEIMEILRMTLFRSTSLDRVGYLKCLAAYFETSKQSAEILESRLASALETYESNELLPEMPEGAENLLNHLRQANISVAIVTNGTQNTRRVLDKVPALKFISEWLSPEDIVLSCECGYTKPDPRAFLASPSVRSAVESGKRVCVIGDQFDTDILGAQIIGADGILLRLGRDSEISGRWQTCRPRIAEASSYKQVQSLINTARTEG